LTKAGVADKESIGCVPKKKKKTIRLSDQVKKRAHEEVISSLDQAKKRAHEEVIGSMPKGLKKELAAWRWMERVDRIDTEEPKRRLD